MVNYCLEAAKTSPYFGSKVVLRNLSNQKYNNVLARLGGYLAEMGQRQIILSDGKEFAIKPQNIFGQQTNDCILLHKPTTNLVNIPDRMGEVCLCKVAVGDREDIARFLCKKHNASIDIKCMGGTTV
eukprot:375590-Ditylum_brightwellii.AAC.1